MKKTLSAQEWYEQGNAYRKQAQWHEAINCYIEAARLDPDSPAVEAKRMLDDILGFYCKDMYNP
ncbi:MAG: tetratricopeptide repeat protein [Prevotella sp.]|nr:tetratricopeptide repeat protein [Prevotella sp.]